MEDALNHPTTDNNPAYACSTERIAMLFGIPEDKIYQYAQAGMLPHLDDGKHDCVWLLNLAIGQQIVDGQRVSPSVTATVVLGWLDSIGQDLDTDDVRAFIEVFERNGFTRGHFNAALDEALAYCDSSTVQTSQHQ
ncbi:hypothetical protein [Paraburkholderia strydomiana]|uniref:hypothetical protein n=1 Tax=Paraburkholderia strydomiana TaxID=1245417 RepID=UPI001BE96014|nr:hypothetical protein [Paraburkholderia strydomiana]MBT2791212.1 hypothetical protein [Paraburkholderia strydomiana]